MHACSVSLGMSFSCVVIAVAHELGVAHPPGYPLFTWMTHAVIRFIPWGSVAWRANLLSVTFASLAGTLVFLATGAMTQGSLGGGSVAVALFSFSRLTWMYSVGAEVRGLYWLPLICRIRGALASTLGHCALSVMLYPVHARAWGEEGSTPLPSDYL